MPLDAAEWFPSQPGEVPDRRPAAGTACPFLSRAGHDALHTIELPDGNLTTDRKIAATADDAGRVVVTKDQDFRDGHLLAHSPRRLLVVTTGNITNDALLSMFETYLDTIVSALEEADYVELSHNALAIGPPRVEDQT